MAKKDPLRKIRRTLEKRAREGDARAVELLAQWDWTEQEHAEAKRAIEELEEETGQPVNEETASKALEFIVALLQSHGEIQLAARLQAAYEHMMQTRDEHEAQMAAVADLLRRGEEPGSPVVDDAYRSMITSGVVADDAQDEFERVNADVDVWLDKQER